MTKLHQSTLWTLVSGWGGEVRAQELFNTLRVHEALTLDSGPAVSRAVLAQAMNMALFAGLVARVPAGRDYVHDVRAAGRRITFDHGAVRTVLARTPGALPAGHQAFARILEPLGFTVTGWYPLERLSMTGRAYTQQDLPEDIAQYFVSELHADRFSVSFQDAADRVLATSHDPLNTAAHESLGLLAREKSLPLARAQALLPLLVACFDRQHDAPTLEDYELLLAESAEMAWISTEGNAFNHATDRVENVEALAEQQRKLGRPMKESIEVSGSGRVRQTALRAARVPRTFRVAATGQHVTREVPGSFYEFITRDRLPVTGTAPAALDLNFDTSNAQGIFKMTAAA